MTGASTWQQANDAYLEAALTWLRLRLARLAGPLPAAIVAAPEPEPEPSRHWFPWRSSSASRKPPLPDPNAPPAPPPTKEVTAEDVAKAAQPLATMEAADPPPALVILGRRLGLSAFERQVLWLCAAMELDTRIAQLCAHARGDAGRPYPTFALALTLFDEASWDALSPERPLRFWRLVEINQPGGQPLTTSALRADERIVSYVKGLNYLDDRLTPLLTPFDVQPDAGDALAPSQQTAVDAIVRQLQLPPVPSRFPVIQLAGSDPSAKQLVAQHAAAALGMHLYRLPAAALPSAIGELDAIVRLCQRESRLLPIALYVDAHDGAATASADSQGAPTPASSVSRLLTRIGNVTFLDSRDSQNAGDWDRSKSLLVLDISKPTPGEQQLAWAAELAPLIGGVSTGDPAATPHAREASGAPPSGAAEPADPRLADAPARLAGQFNLSLSTIRSLARSASADGEGSAADRLWDACRAHTRPRLDTLAQRLDSKATWNDIVLPADSLALLAQISAQVGQRSKVYEEWGFADRMNRGLGISALFTGESGTGKTMAAEVIANDLRLNLYRIDLSGVVSKYIGETEKNLRRLFDAAEDGGAILFFDEADALFGKRSEVKDSHDRYANIEINYLLQRMEAYRGLAILATNMKNALDSAFARRLRFIVSFAFPGQAERRIMWQKAFPAETPTQGLDFERPSRWNLTGGSIHNIALHAAFLAARAGTPVTMPLLLDAARTEFRKLERPINDADFRSVEAVSGAGA